MTDATPELPRPAQPDYPVTLEPFDAALVRVQVPAALREMDQWVLVAGKADETHLARLPGLEHRFHPAAFGNTMGHFGPLTASQGGIGSAGTHGMKPTGSRK